MTYKLQQYPHANPEIIRRLKAIAGEILTNALTLEHVPSAARDLMSNNVIHGIVRAMFRDIAVDCLATHFNDLEERRKDVLDDIVKRTRSDYGMRLRLLQSAMGRTQYGERYQEVLDNLERHVTPEMYGEFVAVVRREYTRY